MNKTLSPLSLRSAMTEDESFFCKLYGAGRAEEMAIWGWNSEQQELFIEMQFTAREQHYRTVYPEQENMVILCNGAPAGRMIVARRVRETVLVDIALTPVEQGKGAGAALLATLQDEATEAAKPLRLHVVGSNGGAIRFYERLGFKIIEDDGSYLKMEWSPKLPEETT
jgi:ribosomal protein S18 acetylase RimI-like enzyme